jgi:hypothetical protein
MCLKCCFASWYRTCHTGERIWKPSLQTSVATATGNSSLLPRTSHTVFARHFVLDILLGLPVFSTPGLTVELTSFLFVRLPLTL